MERSASHISLSTVFTTIYLSVTLIFSYFFCGRKRLRACPSTVTSKECARSLISDLLCRALSHVILLVCLCYHYYFLVGLYSSLQMAYLREYLESLTSVLNTYSGRDKALRSVSFMLLLKAQSSSRKEIVLALAKQCSSARLVLRQFNYPSMIKSCWDLLTTKPMGHLEDFCTTIVTGVYTIYGVVEFLAWISDANIIEMDSARLWRWCLYLWIIALISGIVHQIRLILRSGVEKVNKDLLTLVGLVSDFIAAIHSLPHKFLWSGKLTPKQSATFSLIASLIGFYKAF